MVLPETCVWWLSETCGYVVLPETWSMVAKLGGWLCSKKGSLVGSAPGSDPEIPVKNAIIRQHNKKRGQHTLACQKYQKKKKKLLGFKTSLLEG